MGPGLVVMTADNDAGGLAVYAQAGQNYGTSLLWVLLLLAPALFINQEMVARLGAVTGAGHARLIVERFGRRWGAFAVGDLLALNALTLVTDFIGVALALDYFGVCRYLAVPSAAALLVAVTAARQLPPLGADHVRPRRGQPRRHPARDPHPRRQPLPGSDGGLLPGVEGGPRRAPCC